MLDVATGRGAVLFPAAAVVGPRGRVIGVDLSAEMIAATRADAAAHGVSDVELHHMDAEALAFPDATFEAVLCGFAIFFLLPRFDPGMAEMRRVLRPGGHIAVSTWVDVWGPETAWLEPLQADYLPPPQLPAYTGSGIPPVFDTPDGLTATLTNAGFAHVRVVAETVRFTYADEEAWMEVAFVLVQQDDLAAFGRRLMGTPCRHLLVVVLVRTADAQHRPDHGVAAGVQMTTNRFITHLGVALLGKVGGQFAASTTRGGLLDRAWFAHNRLLKRLVNGRSGFSVASRSAVW